MRKLLLLSVILIFNFSIAFTQTADEVRALQDNLGLFPSKYGLYFNYGINFHNPNFNYLPKYPFNHVKTGFADVSGSGFTIGGFYDIPIFAKMFRNKLSFKTRLGLSIMNATFIDESTTPTVDPDNGELIYSIDQYTFNSSLTALSLEPILSFNIFSGLKAHLGFNLSYLVSATFDQYEMQKKSQAAPWPLEKFDSISTTIPNTSILFSGLLGLSYELALGSRFIITPEVFFNIGLNSVASDVEWSLNSLNLGASVGYIGDRPCPPGMFKNADGDCQWQPCPPGMKRNNEGICVCKEGMFINDQGLCEWPPCKERNFKRNDDGECVQVLFADIKAEPILPNGLPSKTDEIRMKESESMISQSLLNYIFFEELSGDIPKRYKQFPNDEKIGNFRENQIIDAENPLNTYYNLLDIIGYRMSNSPFAKLTLVTYNILGSEANNKLLTQKRLDAVSNYLKKIWKVPDFRLETVTYELPTEAKSLTKELLDEYRRVEIIPDTANYGIIGPVIVNKKVYKAYPPKINFNLDVLPMTQIDSWKIKTFQKDKVYFESQGTGKPPAIISWMPNTKSNTYSENKENIYYSIEIKDKNQEEINLEKPLPSSWIPINPDLKPDENDSAYATYFTLFNFNEKQIDRDILKNSYILEGINFNEYKSKFSLSGFTDRIGDGRSNKILSMERVEAVSKYLTDKRKVNTAYISKQGLGYVELFDNSNPEGRFYNRTVIVEVSTPTEVKVSDVPKVEGCYVIAYSDVNRLNSESIMNILKQRGIDEIEIKEYYEEKVDKTYFRVQTPFYKEQKQATRVWSKIMVAVKQMNLDQQPLIKCEREK